MISITYELTIFVSFLQFFVKNQNKKQQNSNDFNNLQLTKNHKLQKATFM